LEDVTAAFTQIETVSLLADNVLEDTCQPWGAMIGQDFSRMLLEKLIKQ
jgi:hypothetical protein